ncbi:MAG: hypothetical protein LBS52_01530, partial [Dysgonamonadaceae bacterium]|nr:hypothetical protein [Dysgonamonadaceae bacterium]
ELPARKGLSYISADETIVAVNANKITAKDDGKIYIYGSLDYSNVCCSPYYISLMTPGLRHWESHGQCRIRDDEF